MKLLERDGLVSSEVEGEWVLTQEAVKQHVVQSIWLRTPSRVFTPRAGIPLDQHTSLELEMLMADNNWVRLPLTDDKARNPYTANPVCDKNWFCDRHGRFFSSYLVCLLKSQDLFRAGLREIYHGQIDSYYNAILYSLDHRVSLESIAPWKPAPCTVLFDGGIFNFNFQNFNPAGHWSFGHWSSVFGVTVITQAKFYRAIMKGGEPDELPAGPALELMDDYGDLPVLDKQGPASSEAAGAKPRRGAAGQPVEVLKPPDRPSAPGGAASSSRNRAPPELRADSLLHNYMYQKVDGWKSRHQSLNKTIHPQVARQDAPTYACTCM